MAQTSEGQTVRVPDAPKPGGLDGFFKITERGSTMRIEIFAGITTWLTMAYILFLNPRSSVPSRTTPAPPSRSRRSSR